MRIEERIGGCTEMIRGIPFPMGAIKKNNGWNISFEAPKNAECAICFYYKNKTLYRRLKLPKDFQVGSVYSVFLKDFDAVKYYYKLEINGQLRCDPTVFRIVGREQWGMAVSEESLFGCFVEIPSMELDPSAKKKEDPDHILELPYSETIRYVLHPRGYTKHSSSRTVHRGTFLGLVEKIPYLKDLGITQIELMPAYEFNECRREDFDEESQDPKKVEKLNYWGYEEGAYYFAPKASYCATNDPVQEFQQMVREFHKNGIEVVMEFYFGSRCDFYLIHACILFWHIQYHIDGFHINGENVPMTLFFDPILCRAKFFLEHAQEYSFLSSDDTKRFQMLASIDRQFMWPARNFLKATGNSIEEFAESIRRNPRNYTQVNAITMHDGFTLHDLVSYNEKHNEKNGEENRDGSDQNLSWNCGVEGATRKKKVLALRLRQMKNAMAFMMLSQGVPSILAGDEFANSQNGNNNAYCIDDESSWVNWRSSKNYVSLVPFLKMLISMRKEHKTFRMESRYTLMDTKSCGYQDFSYHGTMAWHPEFRERNYSFAVMYCGFYTEDDFFYVIYNMHWQEKRFDLPILPKGLDWHFCFDTQREDFMETFCEPVLLKDQRQIDVMERTVVVLIGKQIRKQENE